jgi:hypothetical protein
MRSEMEKLVKDMHIFGHPIIHSKINSETSMYFAKVANQYRQEFNGSNDILCSKECKHGNDNRKYQ